MKEFTNYESMFAQSIGLEEPWRINKAEYNEETKEVHIYVSARKTAKYECPECGELCDRYDDEETERVWRHGDVVFFPCFIHCRRPRIKCKKHGTRVVVAPWARKGSRYTLLFESYAMLLMKSMPIENARKLLRVSHTSMTRILKYWVNKAVDEDDLSGVCVICVDETSFKRGQSYDHFFLDKLDWINHQYTECRKLLGVYEERVSVPVPDFTLTRCLDHNFFYHEFYKIYDIKQLLGEEEYKEFEEMCRYRSRL